MDMNCFSQYKIFHTFWLVKYVYYSPIHGCVHTCIICNLRLDNQIFKLLYFNFFLNSNDQKRLFMHAAATRWLLFALFNLQTVGTERTK